MGQEVRGVPEAAPLTAPVAEGPAGESSIGRYLASQRRLRGISLAELADLTRIPLRSLERLEAGAYDRGVDGFVRGFVRTVADAMGLDADQSVMRLLAEPATQAVAAPGRGRSGRLALLLAAVVASLLAFAAGIWLLRASLSPSAPRAPEVVYRRDAVRVLADAQGRGAAEVDSPRGDPSD